MLSLPMTSLLFLLLAEAIYSVDSEVFTRIDGSCCKIRQDKKNKFKVNCFSFSARKFLRKEKERNLNHFTLKRNFFIDFILYFRYWNE
jgi:hypothetical protein